MSNDLAVFLLMAKKYCSNSEIKEPKVGLKEGRGSGQAVTINPG